MKFPLPECQDEFDMAVHAGDIKAVLWDFDMWLRNQIKYGEALNATTLDAVRAKLYEILEDHKIVLHD